MDQAADADEEDDGLGYYPDGVKRTLTNEQVAMFRHSEIYAILRARQVARENRDDDSKEDRAAVDRAEMNNGRDDDGVGNEVEEMPLNVSFRSTEDGPEYLDNEYSNPTTFTLNHENESQMEQPADSDIQASGSRRPVQNPRQYTPRKEKRKRTGHEMDLYDDNPINSKIRSRGRVRELDASFAEEQVLDYGDEARTEVDSEPQQNQAIEQPKVEGRKIWWPVLGGE